MLERTPPPQHLTPTFNEDLLDVEERCTRETVPPLSMEYGETELGGEPYSAPVIGERLLKSLQRVQTLSEFDAPRSIIEPQEEHLSKYADQFRLDMHKLKGTQEGAHIEHIYSSYSVPQDILTASDGVEQGLVEGLASASDEAIGRFVCWNAAFIDTMNAENREELQQEFELAKHSTLTFLADSGIPVDAENIQQKIARLRVEYTDPFLSTEQGNLGYFNPAFEFIGVAPQDKVSSRHTMTHELLHALSGRLAIYKTFQFGNEHPVDYIDVPRAGYHHQGGRGGSRFAWLDEAVTEQLTRLIADGASFDYKEVGHGSFFPEGSLTKGVYQDARKFLEIVTRELESDIGLKIYKPLVAGYFEDYEPYRVAGKRSPKWAEAIQKIGDFLSPRQLAIADRLFAARRSMTKALVMNGVERKFWECPGSLWFARDKAEVTAIRTKRRHITPTRRAAIGKGWENSS